MFNDISDKQKARANLILASMAVILVIHGDGKFNSSSFLGGSITFGEELALPIAGSAMFVYFVWRFLLCTGDAIRDFTWDFNTFFYTDVLYRKITSLWKKNNNVDGEKRIEHEESPMFLKLYRYSAITVMGEGSGGLPVTDQKAYFPIHIIGKSFPFTLRMYLGDTFHIVDKPYFSNILPTGKRRKGGFNSYDARQHKNEGKDDYEITAKISLNHSIKLIVVYIKSLIKAVVLKRSFTDLIFPFLIGYYATVLLSYRVTEHLVNL